MATHIHSVEQLEALVMLRESAPKEWDADELSRRLYTHPTSAGQRLADLESKGFLVAREEAGRRFYRYEPRDAAREESVRALAEFYKQFRVTVIDLIYAQPRGQARFFSDAFKLRREGKD